MLEKCYVMTAFKNLPLKENFTFTLNTDDLTK